MSIWLHSTQYYTYTMSDLHTYNGMKLMYINYKLYIHG